MLNFAAAVILPTAKLCDTQLLYACLCPSHRSLPVSASEWLAVVLSGLFFASCIDVTSKLEPTSGKRTVPNHGPTAALDFVMPSWWLSSLHIACNFVPQVSAITRSVHSQAINSFLSPQYIEPHLYACVSRQPSANVQGPILVSLWHLTLSHSWWHRAWLTSNRFYTPSTKSLHVQLTL